MYLSELFPSATVEDALAQTGFAMDVSRARPAEPPSKEVLRILEEKVDPMRLMT